MLSSIKTKKINEPNSKKNYILGAQVIPESKLTEQ